LIGKRVNATVELGNVDKGCQGIEIRIMNNVKVIEEVER